MGSAVKIAVFVSTFLMLGLFATGIVHAQSEENKPSLEAEQPIPKVLDEENSSPKEDNREEESDEAPSISEDNPTPETENEDGKEETADAEIDDIVPPEIVRDLNKLPFPTRRMHELLLAAARSGDIEKLRPYIGYGEDVTMLSLGGIDEDPISFLKSLSGDSEGHEILAILTEVLEAGFVQMDEGTDQEMFVWPYFFAQPLDKLTPAQRVELFSVVTYGDYEDMKAFGAYIFYRVGITPEGRWRFFVAGD